MADPQNPSSSELQTHLDSLDELMAELGDALRDQDWDALVRLNEQIKPRVEPLMTSLETGQIDPELVRTRLEELRQFMDAAGEGATRAKAEAERALKGVNRNRSAAKAYQNVSTTRPK
ncbi:SOS cell division inhibitor [Marinobacter sp. 1-4A]|uniref:SOS cell division inhibitor n=1 Tax=unclassified Marinobacter TaxID=83889 RepID=UPI0019033341|nr:SOS cell division inhibitor [Marinobacter sp. 1-4A]MBK1850186.1 SOS cell division inhibitor [Marinobacter sp. 1-4A]